MAYGQEAALSSGNPQVVGLGYCAWDYVGRVSDLPDFDSPTLDLSELVSSGGGPVATALVALARLGVRTGYIGAVGDDDPGLRIRAAFEEEGVDLRRLRPQSNTRSPVCLVLVQAGTGRRAILCYRGNGTDIVLRDKDRTYLTSAQILHLDAHHLQAAITAAQWMRQSGRSVVLDANKPRPRLGELLTWTDVLITNSSFPEEYTGKRDLEQAASLLLQEGPRLVVSTLGEQGCSCFTRDCGFHVAGFSLPVIDTTGAGDAFHGGFIFGLLQEWSLRRTAEFANAVAALNCTALGGRTALPDLSQAYELLRSTGAWDDHKAR
jgi:sulfofructose kinase